MAALAALVAYGIISANGPDRRRLALGQQALAEAGFPDARVMRGQRPSRMHQCGVGQIQNRGYAYEWRSGQTHGVFCLPVDGRPGWIIVDLTPPVIPAKAGT